MSQLYLQQFDYRGAMDREALRRAPSLVSRVLTTTVARSHRPGAVKAPTHSPDSPMHSGTFGAGSRALVSAVLGAFSEAPHAARRTARSEAIRMRAG